MRLSTTVTIATALVFLMATPQALAMPVSPSNLDKRGGFSIGGGDSGSFDGGKGRSTRSGPADGDRDN
ncbi:hypothetical protein BGW38_009766 [Lunasporangiospora selenospora]|uniref:Uncharacterized protein n=1 Tax=Lunasporangiospora selenospora TaxID=979761 RepID=A0A9P6FZ13_9FUNG|nr:hypothetical protein BGW38_009766 [Lunasporangiospora selenospora]